MKQRVYFTVAVVLAAVIAGLWWTRGGQEDPVDTDRGAPTVSDTARQRPAPPEPEEETAPPEPEDAPAEHAAFDEPSGKLDESPEKEEAPAPPQARFGAVTGEVELFAERGRDYSGIQLTLHTAQAPNANPLRTTYPGPDGAYVFDDLAPGPYVIRCEAPAGYGAHSHGFSAAARARNETAVQVRAGQTAEAATFRLGPASRFSGRVVDASGRPVEDASVEAIRRLHRNQVMDVSETDADGRFSFPVLEPGTPYAFAAYKENLASDIVTPSLDGADDILITLSAEPVRAAGRVLDADGQPIADARVQVEREVRQSAPRRGPRPRGGVTDSQGRWRTEFAPAGEYRFRVDVDGARASKRVEFSAGEERDGIELRLTPPADLTIAGVVREQGGDPVAAVVSAVNEEGQSRAATADSDGAFNIERLANGRYDLRVVVTRVVRPARDADSSPETIRTEPRVAKRGVAAGRNDVVLTVETPSMLTGRLVDESGAPVSDGAVLLRDADQREVGRTRSGEDGRFELFSAENATELFVNHSRYAPKSAPLPRGGFHDREIRLSRGGVIYGVARTTGGRTAERARIVAVGGDFASDSMFLPRSGGRPAVVQPDGSFEVPHLSAGSITLVAHDPELGFASETVHLREGASVRQDLTFRPWLSVEGRVTRDGAPLANAQVYGRYPYARGKALGQTDSNGRFKLDNLVPGVNVIVVQLKGEDGPERLFEHEVSLPESGGGFVDFDLDSTPEVTEALLDR